MQFFDAHKEYMEYQEKQDMWKRIIELETKLSALEKYLGVRYENYSEYVKIKEDK